jgi:hypothetical protein
MSQNWMDYILATGIGQRRTTEAISGFALAVPKADRKTRPEMSVFKGLRKK